MPKHSIAAYFILTNLCCTVLSQITKASKGHHRRPFYIIGHMVNALEEVDDFLEKGANALEADIEFAVDGTVVGTFHGAPCDCFRNCFSKESIIDYLEHIRDTTSSPDSQFRGKMSLLFLNLHTDKVPQSAKKKAGILLARSLWEFLWEGVPPKEQVNVLISIGHTKDGDVIKGILEHLQQQGKQHLLDKIGFDFHRNDPLKRIGRMYKKLGLKQHLWQGDGRSNCVRFLVSVNRLLSAVKARDSNKGYMDKVYHWTVDLPHYIKKSIGHGVDGIVTNRPDNVLRVVKSKSYRNKLRLADMSDSPWTRFRRDATEVKQDTDRELEALGGGEEITSSNTSFTSPSKTSSQRKR
uniref:GP-PDE domain-containing protein n=1 Tax=Amblyomma maculatum TaxID=34609 RepID=G3MSS6_AMBMU